MFNAFISLRREGISLIKMLGISRNLSVISPKNKPDTIKPLALEICELILVSRFQKNERKKEYLLLGLGISSSAFVIRR